MKVTRTYAGEPGRYYPELGVQPDKGDTVTFDSADQVPDDGLWKAPAAKRRAAARRKPGPRAEKPTDTAAADAPAEHKES
jgi:hypothetical protein